jgi:hypothetical protein
MKTQGIYVTVTGDVVRSSALPPFQRSSLQESLLKAIEDCNAKFVEQLAVPFSLTLGDEFQGLLKDLAPAFEVAEFFRRRLYPSVARFGIGRGGLSTAVQDSTAQMDGECFHRSRRALERTKKEGLLVVYETGTEPLDMAINCILRLVQAIQQDWREMHHRRFWLYKDLGELQKVAAQEGVSTVAVLKSLETAKYRAVLRAEEAIRLLLSTLGGLHGASKP